MSRAYTILWSQERCNWLREIGQEGHPLEVVFGGEHTSAPRFTDFGVEPGDCLIPVCLREGALYLVARLRVDRLISIPDYLHGFLGVRRATAQQWGWDLEDKLWARRVADRYRLPTGCVDEAAVGVGDVPIRFDRAVSPTLLARIRFENRRGEQRGLKHIVDGKLKSQMTLQGRVYRLSVQTARALNRVLVGSRKMLRPAQESKGVATGQAPADADVRPSAAAGQGKPERHRPP
jgi:hypothetical protein